MEEEKAFLYLLLWIQKSIKDLKGAVRFATVQFFFIIVYEVCFLRVPSWGGEGVEEGFYLDFSKGYGNVFQEKNKLNYSHSPPVFSSALIKYRSTRPINQH